MSKRLALGLILVFLVVFGQAQATPPTALCYTTTGGVCSVVSLTNPLPITTTGANNVSNATGFLPVPHGGFPATNLGASTNDNTNLLTTLLSTNAAYLKHFQAGLGRVLSGTGNMTILCDGDSTWLSLGAVIGGGTGDGKTLSICGQLLNLFRAAGIPSISQNFIGDGQTGNASTENHTYDPRLVLGSGWASCAPQFRALGGTVLCANSATGSTTFTPTEPIDTIKFCYLNGSGNGTFSYSIDGGLAVNINTNTTAGTACTIVTASPPAYHSVAFNWVSGAQGVYLGSIIDTNSTLHQVNFLIAGWPSSSSTDHANTANSFGGIISTSSLAAYKPDLVLEEGGVINDWNANTSGATTLANLITIGNAWLGNGADFVLVTPNPTAISATPRSQQLTSVAAMFSAATSLAVPIVDYFNAIGTWEIANALGIEFDVYHELYTGYTGQAKIIANFLGLNGANYGGGAEQTIAFQPGLLTAVTNTKSVFGKFVRNSTVDNIIASALLFTCVSNPTVTLYECGTDVNCATSPTTIGSATVTTTGVAVAATVSAPAIVAGDYVAWAISAGTCTSLDISATSQLHSN